MDSILIQNLNYKIGSKQILKNINLRVPKGSIYGYLGRNGAGKSTTIKLLLGLLKEKESNIFIQNKNLKKSITEIHSLTGNLIELPCYYSKLTVFENLKYLDIIHKKGNNRIDEVLDLVDLTKEKKKKSSNLSMGMKQRLGIAMAIFHDPELLVLDEPLNGLDPQGIFEMRCLFQNLNQQGKTIFLSSHILSELDKIATHIGIIENGELIFQGTKNELIGNVEREVKIRVNSTARASSIIHNLNYQLLCKDNYVITIQINSDEEFNSVISNFVLNGIEIYEIESQSENLEKIFINLISKKT